MRHDLDMSRHCGPASGLPHFAWKVRPDRVREFVEKYSTLADDRNPDRIVKVAYANFLQEPLRTFARDEIQRLNGLEIKDRITPVGEAISRRVLELTKDTPFLATSVVVGNIQYPEEVANAVSQKMAATQVLERKQTEIQIEEREKQPCRGAASTALRQVRPIWRDSPGEG